MDMEWRRAGRSRRRRQQAESQSLAVGEATAVLLACWTRYLLLSWDSCKPAAHSTAIRRLFLYKNADVLQSAAFRFLQPALPSPLYRHDGPGQYLSCQVQIPKTTPEKNVCKTDLKLMPTFGKMDLFAVISASCHHQSKWPLHHCLSEYETWCRPVNADLYHHSSLQHKVSLLGIKGDIDIILKSP